MSFDLIRDRGPHFSDPFMLPRSQHSQSVLYRNVLTSGPTYTASPITGGSAFYTGATESIDRHAGTVYDASAHTVNTYKTISSITGSGLIGWFLGPFVAAAFTTTWRITIDGVEYVVPLQDSAQGRTVLGYTFPQQFFGGGISTAGREMNMGAADATSPDGKTTQYRSQPRVILETAVLAAMGAPLLRFKRSLLAEVKVNSVTSISNECVISMIRTD